MVLAAEVASRSPNLTRVDTQEAAVLGSAPDPEGIHEGQATGYYPGTGEGDSSEITGPGDDLARERELTISAFWRLLSDGYDTW